jgi:hypothetical protein
MFQKGQKVKQEFGGPVMVVVGFEPDFIENIITEWEDDDGNIITGKFMEAQLIAADDING